MRYARYDWFEVEADEDIPASPDGERIHGRKFRFDSLHQRLPLVLPANTTVLGP